MWRAPNPIKVAVTRFDRADADLVFAAMRAMAADPLSGDVYKLGDDGYYRVVEGLPHLLRSGCRPAYRQRHRHRAASLSPFGRIEPNG